jgi:hypothetical protein
MSDHRMPNEVELDNQSSSASETLPVQRPSRVSEYSPEKIQLFKGRQKKVQRIRQIPEVTQPFSNPSVGSRIEIIASSPAHRLNFALDER